MIISEGPHCRSKPFLTSCTTAYCTGGSAGKGLRRCSQEDRVLAVLEHVAIEEATTTCTTNLTGGGQAPPAKHLQQR